MPIAYERRDAGRAVAAQVAGLLGRVHQWDAATIARAANAYEADAARLFGIDD
jgi:hypothetical protein